MTVQETGPLVLLMFTVLFALPAAATAAVGVIPSAFAQEEDDDDQDLSPDDDTNTQIAVPITDKDQGAANLGANLAANLDVDVEHIIEETRSTTPPEEEEQQPPEGTCDPFTTDCFCFRDVAGEQHCFSTETECILASGNTEVPPATKCVKVGPG